jgi:hypothetical protein
MEQVDLYLAKSLSCPSIWCFLNKFLNVVKHKDATVILISLARHLASGHERALENWHKKHDKGSASVKPQPAS